MSCLRSTFDNRLHQVYLELAWTLFAYVPVSPSSALHLPVLAPHPPNSCSMARNAAIRTGCASSLSMGRISSSASLASNKSTSAPPPSTALYLSSLSQKAA
eukprot:747035-Hanusia_phi.AAC.3